MAPHSVSLMLSCRKFILFGIFGCKLWCIKCLDMLVFDFILETHVCSSLPKKFSCNRIHNSISISLSMIIWFCSAVVFSPCLSNINAWASFRHLSPHKQSRNFHGKTLTLTPKIFSSKTHVFTKLVMGLSWSKANYCSFILPGGIREER